MEVVALGQTIEHDGDVVLAVKNLPLDCIVLFVSMDTWAEIKDTVEVIHGE